MTSKPTAAPPPGTDGSTTNDSAPHASVDDDKLDAGVWRIAGVVVLGAIMSILDVTVVSVALPTFQTVFDASYATVA